MLDQFEITLKPGSTLAHFPDARLSIVGRIHRGHVFVEAVTVDIERTLIDVTDFDSAGSRYLPRPQVTKVEGKAPAPRQAPRRGDGLRIPMPSED